MKKSLQTIIDHYANLGLRGKELLKALRYDRVYQKLLKERLRKVAGTLKVKPAGRKRYVLSTNEDLEILGKIYRLEKKRLSKTDKEMVKFLRTQLEHDWRAPIVKVLNQLLEKYKQ